MLDRWALQLIRPVVTATAKRLAKHHVSADQLTISGFVLGMLSLPALAFHHYALALVFILLNRIFDGLDGAVARLTSSTERGAYLDIVLDFIFYAAIIFGFALANPVSNALPAAALIFGFMGTGASFLAFAIFAERHQLKSMTYPNKGFYYLNGITEGTETILFLVLMCLIPDHFPALAWLFFVLCLLTTATRVMSGAYTIDRLSNH